MIHVARYRIVNRAKISPPIHATLLSGDRLLHHPLFIVFMKHVYLIFFVVSLTQAAFSQSSVVSTSDIDNFWTAYDTIVRVPERDKQLALIQTLYIDKGTPGLKAFMNVRPFTAERWVDIINKYPKFWTSIRPNTLRAKSIQPDIEASIQRFKTLYPELKEAEMYFTIGGLMSGGTVMGNKILIGTEISTGDASTDVSEFKTDWLKKVFANQTLDNLVAINIHEYVHTQQHNNGATLLSKALHEGACDFITELVLGNELQNSYIQYGRAHHEEVKEAFRKEMYYSDHSNWLSNGGRARVMADLGYYMGYAICKSYYNQTEDKRKAIRDIVELNFTNTKAVDAFLKQSAFYTEPLNKKKLVKELLRKIPVVEKIDPALNGAKGVDPELTEFTIHFSHPMEAGSYSFNYGESGADHFPITEPGSLSADGRVLTVKLALKAATEYEFVISRNKFVSQEGYSLKQDYPVKFKTK